MIQGTIADQLKYAGFPMRHSYSFDHGVLSHLPGLAELITACGKDFKALELHKGVFIVYAQDWLNIAPKFGSQAEPLVAELWLELKNGKEKIHPTS